MARRNREPEVKIEPDLLDEVDRIAEGLLGSAAVGARLGRSYEEAVALAYQLAEAFVGERERRRHDRTVGD